MRRSRLLLGILLGLAGGSLAGCNPALYRAEFAAPQDRWPSTLPSDIFVEAPPPPTVLTYCYRSLAATECYVSPQPTRSGFSGTYPLLP